MYAVLIDDEFIRFSFLCEAKHARLLFTSYVILSSLNSWHLSGANGSVRWRRHFVLCNLICLDSSVAVHAICRQCYHNHRQFIIYQRPTPCLADIQEEVCNLLIKPIYIIFLFTDPYHQGTAPAADLLSV